MTEIVGIKLASLRKLIKGATITLKARDVDDDDEVVELVFSDHKKYKRYLKNASQGKGTRVSLDDFEEINDHEGGSLLGDMRRGLRKVGKTIAKNGIIRDIAKGTIIAAGAAGGTFLGGPMGGIAGSVLAERAATTAGFGLKQDMRKLKKGLNSIGKALKPHVKAIGRELRPIAQEMYNDSKQHAIASMKAQISDKVRGEYMPALADKMDHYTGDSYYGDRFYESANRGLETQGMGIRRIPRVGQHIMSHQGRPQSKKLPSAQQQHINEAMTDMQQYESIGGVVQMTPAEKMAHARGFKKGGSLISDAKRGFKPISKAVTSRLGGSMMPLGGQGRRAGGSMMPLR